MGKAKGAVEFAGADKTAHAVLLAAHNGDVKKLGKALAERAKKAAASTAVVDTKHAQTLLTLAVAQQVRHGIFVFCTIFAMCLYFSFFCSRHAYTVVQTKQSNKQTLTNLRLRHFYA